MSPEENKYHEENPNSIVFNARDNDEMLRISHDGFYVRGVKVQQGEGEAQAVYDGFLAWYATAKQETK